MTTVGRRAAGRLFALLHAKSSSVGAAPWCLTGRSLAGLASAGGGTSSGSRSPVGTDRLAPGAVFTLTKRFSPEDVAGFVALTGDSNPIHVDGGAAAAAGLPGPILPGMLLASLFPAIIGSHFPGAVYLSQTLKFKQYALVRDLSRLLLLGSPPLDTALGRLPPSGLSGPLWQQECASAGC